MVLDKGGHVNPEEAYTPYVDDGDIKIVLTSKVGFVLEKGTVCCRRPFEVARPLRLMRTLSFNWKKSCTFNWGGRRTLGAVR